MLFNDVPLNDLLHAANQCVQRNGFLIFHELLAVFRFHEVHKFLNVQSLFQALKRVRVKNIEFKQNILTYAIRYVLNEYRTEILQTNHTDYEFTRLDTRPRYCELLNRIRYHLKPDNNERTPDLYDESYVNGYHYDNASSSERAFHQYGLG